MTDSSANIFWFCSRLASDRFRRMVVMAYQPIHGSGPALYDCVPRTEIFRRVNRSIRHALVTSSYSGSVTSLEASSEFSAKRSACVLGTLHQRLHEFVAVSEVNLGNGKRAVLIGYAEGRQVVQGEPNFAMDSTLDALGKGADRRFPVL